MLDEDFKKKVKTIFENMDYNTHITEEDEPTNDFIHTGADGVSYSVKVEPDENEFNVLDASGNTIDIFIPSMVDQDGGLPKATRKAIMDDYNQNHSKEEAVAENAEVINKFKKEYGDKAGEAAYYATANKQHRNPETFHKMKEENKVNNFPLTEDKK